MTCGWEGRCLGHRGPQIEGTEKWERCSVSKTDYCWNVKKKERDGLDYFQIPGLGNKVIVMLFTERVNPGAGRQV